MVKSQDKDVDVNKLDMLPTNAEIKNESLNSSIEMHNSDINYERQVSIIEELAYPVIRKTVPYIKAKCVVNGKIEEITLDQYYGHSYFILFFFGIETVQKEIEQL